MKKKVMWDVVLARAKKGFKVLVYKQDKLHKSVFAPTYKLGLKTAKATRRPVLDAVRNRSYKATR